jgi:uncharacterized protein
MKKLPFWIAPARIGLGLFAGRTYATNETIIKIEGKILHHSILWRRGREFASNCIRFGPDTYLDPGATAGRFINHSCEPNAGIRKEKNQLFLFAATRITADQEMVFDYSTTIGDDDIWTMKCTCQARRCRKRVKRFSTLPDDVREDYLARGLVPKYILATLE